MTCTTQITDLVDDLECKCELCVDYMSLIKNNEIITTDWNCDFDKMDKLDKIKIVFNANEAKEYKKAYINYISWMRIDYILDKNIMERVAEYNKKIPKQQYCLCAFLGENLIKKFYNS